AQLPEPVQSGDEDRVPAGTGRSGDAAGLRRPRAPRADTGGLVFGGRPADGGVGRSGRPGPSPSVRDLLHEAPGRRDVRLTSRQPPEVARFAGLLGGHGGRTIWPRTLPVDPRNCKCYNLPSSQARTAKRALSSRRGRVGHTGRQDLDSIHFRIEAEARSIRVLTQPQGLQPSEVPPVFRPNSVSASRRFASALLLTALVALVVASPALAGGKTDRRDMYDVFSVGPRPSQTPAVSETTIKHKAYFTDLEGSNAGWGSIDYRLGQPNAWHRVTGIESCVGNAWWCGVTGLTYGDGYDNNWVQTLKTATPINLASSSGNVLTFKHRCMTEDGYDFAWVLIHDGSTASTWDTLAQYSGFLGTSCINASLPIPDTW